MKFQLHLLLISSLLVVAACSPEPVFRLSPENGPSTFHKGVEYSTLEHGGIVVTLAYYRHLDNRFAMDVEVYNDGETPFRVDPARFSREAFKHRNGSELSGFISSRRAVDPEVELLEIDKAISRTKSARVGEQALFLTLTGLYVAAAIATASDSDAEEAEDNLVESEVHLAIEEEDHRHELMGLEQEREVWELETMRITDLYPGNYIRGLVFFPHQPKAAGYKIILDIDGNKFEARYAQNKFKP